VATIVILDDDQVVLDLLENVMSDAGHTPIAASQLAAVPDGTRADLLIIDLIPLEAYRRELALEWVTRLRDRFGAVPIVVITAHAAAVAEPDQLGASAIIGKPFDVDALLRTVDELTS
jgi:DNA-binding NtrC family response regulator